MGEMIMAEATDVEEASKSNRGVALLIAILALLLAFSELGGTNADNEAIELNVEASNLWSFYQAKTIRRTSILTAAEDMEIRLLGVTEPAIRQAMEKRIGDWKKNAARYESEPETGEGRQELMARAKAAEGSREIQKAKGDLFDISSAMLQIGIVLASATIITGAIGLAWIACGLGLVGTVLMILSVTSPMLLGTIF
jgi:hypothetical protein